jgi:hypothetical protein
MQNLAKFDESCKKYDLMVVVPATSSGCPTIVREPRAVFIKKNPDGLSAEQIAELKALCVDELCSVCSLHLPQLCGPIGVHGPVFFFVPTKQYKQKTNMESCNLLNLCPRHRGMQLTSLEGEDHAIQQAYNDIRKTVLMRV